MSQNRADEKIADAVEYAIDSGYDVNQFIESARSSWAEYMREKAIRDARSFTKAIS